jgi:hypothetical protein
VIIYVDDFGNRGTPETINKIIDSLWTTLKVKTIGEMEKFAGCDIIVTDDIADDWIHQPKLLSNFKVNFKPILGYNTWIYKTPSEYKTLII